MDTEATILAQFMHTPIEVEALLNKLQAVTKQELLRFRRWIKGYYERGGRQPIIMLITEDGKQGLSVYLEQLYRKAQEFDDLPEEDRIKLVETAFNEKITTAAQFEAAIKGISLQNSTFNYEAHTAMLGKFRSLCTKSYPDYWSSLPKESQIRYQISCMAPASFRSSARDRVKNSVISSFYDALAILAEEADEEDIRTSRNAAARASNKSLAVASAEPPIERDRVAGLLVEEDDSDPYAEPDVDHIPRRANLTSQGECTNCKEASRFKTTVMSHTLKIAIVPVLISHVVISLLTCVPTTARSCVHSG